MASATEAIQKLHQKKSWIASSQVLLAMTNSQVSANLSTSVAPGVSGKQSRHS
jgi:hypothetical protein